MSGSVGPGWSRQRRSASRMGARHKITTEGTMLWSNEHARAGVRTTVTAIAALALLTALFAGSASAAGCTNTWTNTAGGSWFNAANWSSKAVPSSSDEACITAAGTYTVEMSQTSTVSLK